MHECVVCHKRVSWKFWLCSECEEKYGYSQEDPDRPEWVRFLIRDAARERREDEKYTNMRSYEDFDNSEDSDMSEADKDALKMVYAYNLEVVICTKFDYENWTIETTNGGFEIKDSDWEAVYSYSF